MSRVPPGGAARVRRSQAIESLLADLGSQLRRGAGASEGPGCLPVGRQEVDCLLGGGFPLGGLSEISGASSSGRMSLALALLAHTTRRGELAAWIDAADAFDPSSAERVGVDLDRVLWIRARTLRESTRAAERLLQTEGFPLVLLDWTRHDELVGTAVGSALWIRLTRLAASSRSALLLLSRERLAGSHAEMAVKMEPVRARFTGTPSLLETLETRMLLVRSRSAAVDPDAAFEIRLTPSSLRAGRTPHESAA